MAVRLSDLPVMTCLCVAGTGSPDGTQTPWNQKVRPSPLWSGGGRFGCQPCTISAMRRAAKDTFSPPSHVGWSW